MIVEGDHAHIAFGVAGDEALRRAENLLGVLPNRARRARLLPFMADGENGDADRQGDDRQRPRDRFTAAERGGLD